MKENKKLNALNVAGLYVGAIIGAGFASGREIWQFFGLFGEKGIYGVVIFALLFFAIGHFIRYIALKLDTDDMGAIIVPGGNKKLEKIVGCFMAIILANVLVIMTAAGSSLLNQQIGLPYWSGGIIITVMVVATVLGDFERLSRIFKWIMPVLCAAIVITCGIVILVYPDSKDMQNVYIEPSPTAPNWISSAFSYTAYNVLALISIVAAASLNSKSKAASGTGVSAGGIFLGALAMMVLFTVQRDMIFSRDTDMPVLGYANRVSDVLGWAYTFIMFFTVYSAAAGNFYGFSTRIKEGHGKKRIVIGAAAVAYLVGLIGFKNIVKYVSPIMGYIGIVIILMLSCNFISVWNRERKMKNSSKAACNAHKKTLPEPLVDVTGGPGGMSVLIRGNKTVLHDCGMACFHHQLIENIEKELKGRDLDYIILSHSHYDHMGALPYLLKRWPKVKVCAGEKTQSVFERKGAIAMIEEMGKNAAEFYGKDAKDVTAKGLRVDVVLKDGDILDLGYEKILCFETKGHTDCSMSFFLKPYGIIFASESTGVLEKEGIIHTSVLKSYDESLESARLLKLLPCSHIIIPHYGALDEKLKDKYFDMYIEAAEKERKLLQLWISRGLSSEEVFNKHKEIYWSEKRALEQPFRAYKMNTELTIRMLMKEMKEETEGSKKEQ